jgi:hypothetical protein
MNLKIKLAQSKIIFPIIQSVKELELIYFKSSFDFVKTIVKIQSKIKSNHHFYSIFDSIKNDELRVLIAKELLDTWNTAEKVLNIDFIQIFISIHSKLNDTKLYIKILSDHKFWLDSFALENSNLDDSDPKITSDNEILKINRVKIGEYKLNWFVSRIYSETSDWYLKKMIEISTFKYDKLIYHELILEKNYHLTIQNFDKSLADSYKLRIHDKYLFNLKLTYEDCLSNGIFINICS